VGHELTAVIFGLAAAASWGAGDFSGGVASKRGHVYGVVILSQAAGALFLLLLAVALANPRPLLADMVWGGLAGVAGAIGLVNLYRGLAQGRMAVVAPLTAVFAAAVPVLIGSWLDGLPDGLQIAGLGLAFVAVWLVARSGEETAAGWGDLGLPLLAGLGFGLFFVLVDQVSAGAVFWPLVAARGASISFMLVVVLLRGRGEGSSFGLWPTGNLWLTIVLAGLLDAGGNAFFALSAQAGRLDIAAVLSSLYPVTTVLLARLFLGERLSRQQGIGVVAALAAILFITA
jgi:drug/metabolite transporter (DMT)-like permease